MCRRRCLTWIDRAWQTEGRAAADAAAAAAAAVGRLYEPRRWLSPVVVMKSAGSTICLPLERRGLPRYY